MYFERKVDTGQVHNLLGNGWRKLQTTQQSATGVQARKRRLHRTNSWGRDLPLYVELINQLNRTATNRSGHPGSFDLNESKCPASSLYICFITNIISQEVLKKEDPIELVHLFLRGPPMETRDFPMH